MSSRIRARIFCVALLIGLLRASVLFALSDEKGWPTLSGEHFVVHYETEAAEARRTLQVAEELYANLSQRLPLRATKRVDIWIAESPEELEALIHAPIIDWAQGYAFPMQGEIVIRSPKGPDRFEEIERVTRHEVGHIALGQLVGDHVRSIPLWFHEGFAMYVSEAWSVRDQWTILSNAVLGVSLSLEALRERFPADAGRARLAYASAFSATRSLVLDYSYSQFLTLLARLGEGEEFDDAFVRTFGVTTAMFDVDWQERATSGMAWLAVLGGALALGSFFTPIIVIGYWRRRRVRRDRLREWEEQEARPDVFFRP